MQVIVANRLIDGLVVFRESGGGWGIDIATAERLEGDAVADAVAGAKADEARQIVLDPYPIDVAVIDGAVVPKSLKERIRAAGPTVPSSFPDQMRPRSA